MQLVGAVLLARAPRAGDQRRVGGQALPRGASREHAEEDGKVRERRDEPLHPDEHDVDARSAGHEPAVALVRYEDDRARLATPKFAPVMPTSAVWKRLPELPPRRLRQLLELGVARLPVTRDRSSATSSFVFSIAGARMCTGCSPASWRMYSPRSVPPGLDARGLERLVQPDLLRRHRLRLRRELRAGVPRRRRCTRSRRAPAAKNVLAAPRLDGLAEAADVRVEVVDHAHPRLVGTVAELLRIVERLPHARAARPSAGSSRGRAPLRCESASLSRAISRNVPPARVTPLTRPRLSRGRSPDGRRARPGPRARNGRAGA